MEPRWASEIAHGVVGMTRVEGNKILKKLLAKYEDKITSAPKGKTYEECWNLKTKQPIQEYKDLYKKIKAEMTELGIKFKS
jgi:methylamine--corrinoid protein Co-methyltransferase